MTRSLKFWLSTLAIALITASCARDESGNVNQDSIFTEYRLVYESADDKTYARVTFRFGGATGTILDLTDPAVASINGDLLTYKPLLGYHEKDYAGPLGSGTFSYTDLDNNTFENTVVLAKAISFPAGLDSIAQAAAYTLSWEGDPISLGESVIVTINGINEGDAKIFTTQDEGATSIILDKDKLEGLGIGEATAFMERWTTQLQIEGTGEGGTVWSRYIADPIKVQINE